MPLTQTPFSKALGIRYPIIGGAMYPCSNTELVAAISDAGGIGIVQPMTLAYVFKTDLRSGLRAIRALTDKPIGLNAILEASSKRYLDRMQQWVDIALEEGVRFFITALGQPKAVVQAVHQQGGIVFHDVTERKWAQIARDSGVDGFICVNQRAGGHAGRLSPQELFDSIASLGLPLVAAGGISTAADIQAMLSLGYQGVQLGTRFIASTECSAHEDYKNAIVRAKADDIVLTDKISGVPVSVIRTPRVERMGTKASGLSRYLLRHPRFKHWMRLFYTLKSMRSLKEAALKGVSYQDFWQAGKSVEGISAIKPVKEIMRELTS